MKLIRLSRRGWDESRILYVPLPIRRYLCDGLRGSHWVAPLAATHYLPQYRLPRPSPETIMPKSLLWGKDEGPLLRAIRTTKSGKTAKYVCLPDRFEKLKKQILDECGDEWPEGLILTDMAGQTMGGDK